MYLNIIPCQLWKGANEKKPTSQLGQMTPQKSNCSNFSIHQLKTVVFNSFMYCNLVPLHPSLRNVYLLLNTFWLLTWEPGPMFCSCREIDVRCNSMLSGFHFLSIGSLALKKLMSEDLPKMAVGGFHHPAGCFNDEWICPRGLFSTFCTVLGGLVVRQRCSSSRWWSWRASATECFWQSYLFLYLNKFWSYSNWISSCTKCSSAFVLPLCFNSPNKTTCKTTALAELK